MILSPFLYVHDVWFTEQPIQIKNRPEENVIYTGFTNKAAKILGFSCKFHYFIKVSVWI